MNERIKIIRNNAKLTQQEFSDRIGIKRNTVALYESGKSGVSDAVIKLICKEFSVSEVWLRTGEGDMYDLPEDRTAAIVADLLDKQCPTYNLIINIIDKYRKLDPVSQSVIDEFLDNLLKGED